MGGSTTDSSGNTQQSNRDGEARSFAIGELATELAITPRTIRFYEDQGLIQPLRRGGQRIYSERDRERLQLICRSKRLGFSLAEIRDLLDLYLVDGDGINGVQVEWARAALMQLRQRRKGLKDQLADIRAALSDLTRLEDRMLEHFRRHGVPVSDD